MPGEDVSKFDTLRDEEALLEKGLHLENGVELKKMHVPEVSELHAKPYVA